MTIHLQTETVTVYAGDCLHLLAALPDASVDAVVTDPPYGLEFMGKDWDAPWKDGKPSRQWNDIDQGTLGGFTKLPNHSRVNNLKCGRCARWKFSSNPCDCTTPDFPNARHDAMLAFQAWCGQWATECLRILKPGGHLAAFGGTRTWHRLASAIEDAGFEIRDNLAWLYGSGFPKSHDVSKAIDKAAGADRETIGVRVYGDGHIQKSSPDAFAPPIGTFARTQDDRLETAPATDAARQWEGWGTALKPAFEPIILARKPLAGTVAANTLQHGTGGLNIDGCRIGQPDGLGGAAKASSGFVDGHQHDGFTPATKGRWPANVILDETTAELVDQQSGISTSRTGKPRGTTKKGMFANSKFNAVGTEHDDTGGASRFFYTAKAGRKERPQVNGVTHPTVKPLALMRWLVRLVTPPGGLVCDPFAGTGTTAEACQAEGLRCIAIEREPDYLPLITARLTPTAGDNQPTLFDQGTE